MLSLFPGVGLLDRAFEEEGFVVVRGPDLLWGGDIRRFHPPPGRFDGVVGGPPCQAFSSLRHLLVATGKQLGPNLVPEFERCVAEAQPSWFIMENVEAAPIPTVLGYIVDPAVYDNRVAPWQDGVGGEQSRRHRFSFGTRDGRPLGPHFEIALQNPKWSRRVLACGGYTPCPVEGGNGDYMRRGSDGKPVRRRRDGGRLPKEKPQLRPIQRMSLLGRKDTAYFREARRLQGLPDEWDLPGFTVAAKVRALGNGVPLPMGRALARAVRRALNLPNEEPEAGAEPDGQ